MKINSNFNIQKINFISNCKYYIIDIFLIFTSIILIFIVNSFYSRSISLNKFNQHFNKYY